MIPIILCLITSFIMWDILRTRYYEKKNTAATFAIFAFIGASLLFSYILAPTTTTETKYGICKLIIHLDQDEAKSNKDIVIDLERAAIGYDTLVINEIRYDHTKSTYLNTMYPKKMMERLVNRNTNKYY